MAPPVSYLSACYDALVAYLKAQTELTDWSYLGTAHSADQPPRGGVFIAADNPTSSNGFRNLQVREITVELQLILSHINPVTAQKQILDWGVYLESLVHTLSWEGLEIQVGGIPRRAFMGIVKVPNSQFVVQTEKLQSETVTKALFLSQYQFKYEKETQ